MLEECQNFVHILSEMFSFFLVLANLQVIKFQEILTD